MRDTFQKLQVCDLWGVGCGGVMEGEDGAGAQVSKDISKRSCKGPHKP